MKPAPPPSARSMERVLDDEREQVAASRSLRLGGRWESERVDGSLTGLSFSGGGIRSATFNLGVLQAFAQHRILRCFDYLSTVSGGGYIGSWLMAWMHHEHKGIRDMEEALSPRPYSASVPGDPPQVQFLRSYSNYLTPRKGLLRADFWTFTLSYLRNTILNLSVLLLALIALLLLPRAIIFVSGLLPVATDDAGDLSLLGHTDKHNAEIVIAAGLVLGLIAVWHIGRNLAWVAPTSWDDLPGYTKERAIRSRIVTPLILAAAVLSYGLTPLLFRLYQDPHEIFLAFGLGFVLYFGLWLGAGIFIPRGREVREHVRAWIPRWPIILGTAGLAGLIGGGLFIPYTRILLHGAQAGSHWPGGLWHVVGLGTPLMVGIILLIGVLHLGLMGRDVPDELREWWGRLGAWLFLYGLAWLALFVVAIYLPVAVGRFWQYATRWSGHMTASAILAWAASTAYGILSGKGKDSGQLPIDAKISKKFLNLFVRSTPYIFIAGLFTLVSVVIAGVLAGWSGGQSAADRARLLVQLPSDDVEWIIPVVLAAFLAAAFVLAWRVDVNQFSMANLYRNRLVRCYLGASVPGRKGQPFTGFNPQDDFPLSELKIPTEKHDASGGRPFPIYNTSLNMVSGKELALQTRKARSFSFTPLYSGFARAKPKVEMSELAAGRRFARTSTAMPSTWEAIYSPTSENGSEPFGKGRGPGLGAAVAISGAAASPNMGYHTSPALSFMMTLFNVRLGWWMGNPGAPAWETPGPRFGFCWLLNEMLGLTSDTASYVYLSDGGHFENLGIYELVRRRCRLIISSDAGFDPDYGFGDLANAIERCRTDFGVEIEIEKQDLMRLVPPDKAGEAQAHFAIGAIHYEPGNPREDGILIYLKPNLTKDDPEDLALYRKQNKVFPHDPTGNQWYDENRFEAYRALGKSVALAAAPAIEKYVRGILKNSR